MTQSSDLLTSAQVAAILGKSIRTVHRMANDGTLPTALRLPGQTGAVLFTRADVEAYRVAS